MGMRTFAAIDIGSYHVRMDIYEMSQQTGIRHIDTVRCRAGWKWKINLQ